MKAVWTDQTAFIFYRNNHNVKMNKFADQNYYSSSTSNISD